MDLKLVLETSTTQLTAMAALRALSAQSLFNVKGWVAVVTGGGTGLGLMTAKSLAANGVKVYVTGRRADKLKEAELQDAESGGSIIGLQMDVTDKQSIRAGYKQIAEKEKFVNFLVSESSGCYRELCPLLTYLADNAGVTSKNWGPKGMPAGSVQEVSDAMLDNQDFEDWTSIYKVNVASCYVCVAYHAMRFQSADIYSSHLSPSCLCSARPETMALRSPVAS